MKSIKHKAHGATERDENIVLLHNNYSTQQYLFYHQTGLITYEIEERWDRRAIQYIYIIHT
jgi:hypothetical protein